MRKEISSYDHTYMHSMRLTSVDRLLASFFSFLCMRARELVFSRTLSLGWGSWNAEVTGRTCASVWPLTN